MVWGLLVPHTAAREAQGQGEGCARAPVQAGCRAGAIRLQGGLRAAIAEHAHDGAYAEGSRPAVPERTSLRAAPLGRLSAPQEAGGIRLPKQFQLLSRFFWPLASFW